MNPNSPLLKLLQLMENLYVVAGMVVFMIMVRLLYANYLKRIGVPVLNRGADNSANRKRQ